MMHAQTYASHERSRSLMSAAGRGLGWGHAGAVPKRMKETDSLSQSNASRVAIVGFETYIVHSLSTHFVIRPSCSMRTITELHVARPCPVLHA